LLASLVFMVVGLGLLAYASDQFVLGAARVALILNVAPLVVGVVVVGFGTSAPEMLVSVLAAVGDEPEVAVGNVVGSNLANLTLILGIGALLCPMVVQSKVVRREAPFVVAATILFAVFVQNGFTRLEGVILLAAMAAVLTTVLVGSQSGGEDPLGPETVELADPSHHRIGVEGVRTLLGLIGTVAGAQLLLTGALDIAERAGLGEGFVGATLVALGTSLPELVTVVQSARRSETDLIVGNLLGSNLFNALAVAGLAGVAAPAVIDAPNLTTVATGVTLGVALLAWRMMHTGLLVSRREGLVLLGIYAITLPFLT
jgi:cation:H+ antiporter